MKHNRTPTRAHVQTEVNCAKTFIQRADYKSQELGDMMKATGARTQRALSPPYPIEENERMSQKDPFTLFDLTETIKAIISDIIDAESVSDKEQVNALMEELDTLYDARESKHEAYVHVIKNSLAGAENHQSVSDEFGARARALTNLAKRLKQRLLEDMEQHGEEVVNAGIFKIARQRNSQPSVVLHTAADELPEEFQRVTIEADKDALREALNAGETLNGVTLHLGEHIRIRVG